MAPPNDPTTSTQDQPAPGESSATGPAKPYAGPERRSSMRIWQEKVDKRLKAGDERMQQISDGLEKNTQATENIKADTSELIELLNSVKGAFKVLDMLARLARPLGFLAAAGASFYAFYVALKGGGGKA